MVHVCCIATRCIVVKAQGEPQARHSDFRAVLPIFTCAEAARASGDQIRVSLVPSTVFGRQTLHLGAQTRQYGGQTLHLDAQMRQHGRQMLHLDAEMEQYDAQMRHLDAEMEWNAAELLHLDAQISCCDAQKQRFGAVLPLGTSSAPRFPSFHP
jgi:hypothetical protein